MFNPWLLNTAPVKNGENDAMVFSTLLVRYGDLLKWGYPQFSSILIGLSFVNHPVIGMPPFTLIPIAIEYHFNYTILIYHYWLVVWNIFSIYWECHHPNWRTPSFFRGLGQPPTSWNTIIWWLSQAPFTIWWFAITFFLEKSGRVIHQGRQSTIE